MTKFVDLHLCPPLSSMDKADAMIRLAGRLGYKAVGFALPRNISNSQVEKLKTICDGQGVDFVSRVDLAANSPAELLRLLKQVRRRFEVVAVVCASKAVARQAAKDHRVDLLCFKAADTRQRFFDRSEAELASNASAALEVDVQSILALSGFQRARLLSTLRKEAAVAAKYHVPVVVSSGAADELQLRAPRDLAALAMLFGLDEEAGLEALSTCPFGIVARNRAKLGEGFVAPGIRVVRRGRDC